MAVVNVSSAWIVRNGVYRQMSEADWRSVYGNQHVSARGIYVRENSTRLLKVFDNTPPNIAPSSVVAYDAGSGNELGVTWSTSGVHPLWDALVQYYESVPAFDPGDPPVLTLRESETVSAASGGAVSSYQFLIGAQAVVEVRFKMGTGNGPTTTSNTVTF